MTKSLFAISIFYLTFIPNILGQSLDSLIQLGNEKCFTQPDSAIYYFDLALKQFPNNKNVILSKTKCLLYNNNSKNALECIDSFISLNDTDAQLYFTRGTIINYINPTDSVALKDYRKAIEIQPDYFDAIFNIAVFYYNMSIETITKIKYDQTNYKENLLKLKQYYLQNALLYMEMAYVRDPDFEPIQSALIFLYNELNLVDKKNEIEKKHIKKER